MKIMVEAFKCGQCGYVWIPIVAKPKKCPNPKCQSPKWDEEKEDGKERGRKQIR